jgi:hypothetical protein
MVSARKWFTGQVRQIDAPVAEEFAPQPALTDPPPPAGT